MTKDGELVITPEMRSAMGRDLARARWAKPEWKSKKKRAEFARFVGSHSGGRPPKGPRCPCGAMSAKRAKERGHKCVKATGPNAD